MNTSITLYAMTEKGFAVLRDVYRESPEIITSVVSARDSHVENDYFSEIEGFCLERQISFAESQHAKPPSGFVLAISWRWLIPTDTATVIVLHDSLLPKLRGFNPLVAALIQAEPEIGVTALLASEEYDQGDILDQERFAIDYPITIQEAIDLSVQGYLALARRLVRRILLDEQLVGTPQNESIATYSHWRDEEDYRIDWRDSAEDIRRFVDAVGPPYKGASTVVDGQILRVRIVEIAQDVSITNRTPGKVIFVRKGHPIVTCGKGLLLITDMVTEEGSQALPLKRFRTRFG